MSFSSIVLDFQKSFSRSVKTRFLKRNKQNKAKNTKHKTKKPTYPENLPHRNSKLNGLKKSYTIKTPIVLALLIITQPKVIFNVVLS